MLELLPMVSEVNAISEELNKHKYVSFYLYVHQNTTQNLSLSMFLYIIKKTTSFGWEIDTVQ